jgi:cytochrome P450
MTISIILILLIFILLFLIVYLIYKRFCYFSNRSIPSPPISSLIFGHLTDLWSAKLYSEQLQKWTRQYGSVYGLFEGTRPVYVTSDINFIEEVFITQFARFYSRGPHLASDILGREYDNVLSTNIAKTWKRQRKILNPTFSGAKMKRLLPTVETCVNIFMERLALIPNETIINIYEMYKRLTIDVICKFLYLVIIEMNWLNCI